MKEKIVMSDKEFWFKQRIEKATKEEIINYYRKKLKILSMICVICIIGIYLFGIFSLFNQAKNYAETEDKLDKIAYKYTELLCQNAGFGNVWLTYESHCIQKIECLQGEIRFEIPGCEK